jgi:hypothetical protein
LSVHAPLQHLASWSHSECAALHSGHVSSGSGGGGSGGGGGGQDADASAGGGAANS